MKITSPIRLCLPYTLLPILFLFILFGNLIALHSANKSLPTTALAGPSQSASLKPAASLNDFSSSVINGQSDEVVGVYIPGLLALPVGQQPKGNASYVTREPHKATQFSLASKYGTVGILAHNDLAGAQFSSIRQNQYAIIVYGDGRLEYYIIEEFQEYQALTPTSTFSDFINQDGSNEKLTAGQLFSRVYGQDNRLVLQTCIAAHGDPSWGRLFIIAKPANHKVLSVIQQTSLVLELSSFGLATR